MVLIMVKFLTDTIQKKNNFYGLAIIFLMTPPVKRMLNLTD